MQPKAAWLAATPFKAGPIERKLQGAPFKAGPIERRLRVSNLVQNWPLLRNHAAVTLPRGAAALHCRHCAQPMTHHHFTQTMIEVSSDLLECIWSAAPHYCHCDSSHHTPLVYPYASKYNLISPNDYGPLHSTGVTSSRHNPPKRTSTLHPIDLKQLNNMKSTQPEAPVLVEMHYKAYQHPNQIIWSM